MDLQLLGKQALVTGSTAGIGFGIARGLALEGASVIVNGRTKERVDAALAAIGKNNVRGFPGDLSKTEVIRSFTRQYPELDILVNNLGTFEARPFAEIEDE